MTKELAESIAQHWNERNEKIHSEEYRSHAEATGFESHWRVEIKSNQRTTFSAVTELAAYSEIFTATAYFSARDGECVAVLC